MGRGVPRQALAIRPCSILTEFAQLRRNSGSLPSPADQPPVRDDDLDRVFWRQPKRKGQRSVSNRSTLQRLITVPLCSPTVRRPPLIRLGLRTRGFASHPHGWFAHRVDLGSLRFVIGFCRAKCGLLAWRSGHAGLHWEMRRACAAP